GERLHLAPDLEGRVGAPAVEGAVRRRHEARPVCVEPRFPERRLEQAARAKVVVEALDPQEAAGRRARAPAPALVGEVVRVVVADVRDEHALDVVRMADEEEVAPPQTGPRDVALRALEPDEEPQRVPPQAPVGAPASPLHVDADPDSMKGTAP